MYTGSIQAEEQDHGHEDVLDWKLLEAAKPALENQAESIGIVQRKEYRPYQSVPFYPTKFPKNIKSKGFPDDTIHFKFKGTAGQSFGAFNTSGVTLELEGDANDYFGKGLFGAKLIVYPSRDAVLFRKKISSLVM